MMEQIMELVSARPLLAVGILFVALGTLLLIGAALKWRWVLEGSGRRRYFSLLIKLFGARGAMIINSAIIIICGVVFIILS